MTLNQVIKRLEKICLSHKQIRNFYQGQVVNFISDQKTNYSSAFLQFNSGGINPLNSSTSVSYRLYFLDLVNVSEASSLNETEVHSDMLSVAEDIVSLISDEQYNDWAVDAAGSVLFLTEYDSDMVAGVSIDLNIRTIYKREICGIPFDGVIDDNFEAMKEVFDYTYIANGGEGNNITIPVISGKKIIFVSRENSVIYKVSNNPDSSEYTWNNAVINLGTPTNQNERFLILYRNY